MCIYLFPLDLTLTATNSCLWPCLLSLVLRKMFHIIFRVPRDCSLILCVFLLKEWRIACFYNRWDQPNLWLLAGYKRRNVKNFHHVLDGGHSLLPPGYSCPRNQMNCLGNQAASSGILESGFRQGSFERRLSFDRTDHEKNGWLWEKM